MSRSSLCSVIQNIGMHATESQCKPLQATTAVAENITEKE
jgi:hypothetical protein